ncbi:MAG TPA: outer membrane protein assembly factor BamE [Steroidobacteraceae bacterium]|nr:outer membrane protein assembly factor BamE [Steroidobacteraceae bacterium]
MEVTTPGRWSPLRSALRPLAVMLCLAALLGASACIYHMPVQQGNHLDQTIVAQVKPGMTRAQVRYLLGTPMVPGGFENDRWDYEYYLRMKRLHSPRHGRVIVHFKNDLVESVDSNVLGNDAEPVSSKPINAPGA